MYSLGGFTVYDEITNSQIKHFPVGLLTQFRWSITPWWVRNRFESEFILALFLQPAQFITGVIFWCTTSITRSSNMWQFHLLYGYSYLHERARWTKPCAVMAPRAVKITLSWPLEITPCVPQEKIPRSHNINPLLTKLVQSRLLVGLVLRSSECLCTSTPPWSINTQ